MRELPRAARISSPLFFLLAAAAAAGCSSNGSAPSEAGADADGSPFDGAASDAASLDARASSDAGNDGGASVDGSSDATLPTDAPSDAPSTTDGSTDGSSDADTGDALAPLSCARWRYTSPVVLEDFEGSDAQGAFNSEVSVISPGVGQARVVVQPSAGPAFRFYGFDKLTRAVSTLDGPPNAATELVSVRPFTLASSSAGSLSQILVQSNDADGSDATQVSAYLVPDTMPMTGPLPAPIVVSPGWGGAVAVPLNSTTVFDAVSYLGSTTGGTVYYGLGVALGTTSSEGSLATVSSSDDTADIGNLALAHANGNVYVFSSNATSHAGESQWVVPDTAVVPGLPPSRAFDTGEEGRMIDVAPAAAADAGATNIAYWSTPIDGSSSTIHVGQVANADLGTVTAADLVSSRTYSAMPLSTASYAAAWHGDDLMIVGPPSASGTTDDAGASAGVFLLWVDAHGDVRAEQTVLQNRAGIRLAGASPASVTTASAAWDVAWIETHPDGTEALLYNELDCDVGD
jgi:hypothetical protein